MCQICLRSDCRVEKKEGVQTDRQTDKWTLQFYIVDEISKKNYTSINIPLNFKIVHVQFSLPEITQLIN